MGLVEVGAYLEELRNFRRLTRPEVAQAIGLSLDSIEYAERGRGRLNGAGLLRLIKLLGGSYDEVVRLVDDDTLTVDEARKMARRWAIRPTVLGDHVLTPDEEFAELWDLALYRAGGDVDEARRLLLQALDTSLPKRKE
jgi:transcriptional regulator with XRE-family HTH domain